MGIGEDGPEARMLDNIKAITVFAQVAERGSFRAGAAALGLSPSVVSHHVSSLEAEIGTALLHRSTRKLSLTPAGERLLERVQPLIASAQVAIEELSADSAAAVGPLRVTMPTPVAFGAVMPLLRRFAQENAGVALSLTIADGRQDLVAEGFDVALRMGWHEPGAMKSRVLYSAECVVVTSGEYLAGRPLPVRPADAASWDWVHHSAGPRTITLRHPVHGAEPAGRVDGGITTNSAIGVLQLVAAGAGVAKLPLSVAASAIGDGRLVALFPDWIPPRAEVRAFWSSSEPRSGLSRRLVDYLSAGLTGSTEMDVVAA